MKLNSDFLSSNVTLKPLYGKTLLFGLMLILWPSPVVQADYPTPHWLTLAMLLIQQLNPETPQFKDKSRCLYFNRTRSSDADTVGCSIKPSLGCFQALPPASLPSRWLLLIFPCPFSIERFSSVNSPSAIHYSTIVLLISGPLFSLCDQDNKHQHAHTKVTQVTQGGYSFPLRWHFKSYICEWKGRTVAVQLHAALWV